MSGKTGIWDQLSDLISGCGIDLEMKCGSHAEPSQVRMVCLSRDLGDSIREMERGKRSEVVMVRVDGQTSQDLDDWVDTDVVSSRSEAAALFMREGLKVWSGDLDQLRRELGALDEAKQRLKEKAREVLGGTAADEEEGTDPPLEEQPGDNDG